MKRREFIAALGGAAACARTAGQAHAAHRRAAIRLLWTLTRMREKAHA
jgi:hypothetical protein